MTKQKASIEQILSDVEDGLSLSEIAEKFGYADKGTISERIKRNGYSIRSKITKNTGGYSGDKYAGLVSIPHSLLMEFDYGDDTPYIEIEKIDGNGEQGLKILFKEDRVSKDG